jgi:cytochrome P450
VSGLTPERIDEVVEVLARFAAGEPVVAPAGAAHELPRLFRYLADDAKAFYLEAAAARPSRVDPSSQDMARWVYTETTLGGVLYRVRARLASSTDPAEQRAQGGIVPGVFIPLSPPGV